MRTSTELLAELKRLHPLSIDLSLERILRLLARLGDPHLRLAPVIHIAGTNGKGSLTAYLKAMLEAAGRRVHVYTSPHLVRFHERISLAGADGRSLPIAEAALVRLLSRVEEVNAGAEITFFEITTAAALLAFAEQPADAVILEVGLGGRLDTTNVVERPMLCVITPVSMDHTERLGGTLARIAAEKAGILKAGSPVVVARQEDAALEVIRDRIGQLGIEADIAGEDFDAYEQKGRLVFQSADRLIDLPLPALAGAHQIVNAGTAVAAGLRLGALGVDERAIEAGLTGAVWPARLQALTGGPLAALAGGEVELWLDGGHNPAAGEALAHTMADMEERTPKPLDLIVGMMGHKDAAGFLRPFAGLARSLVAVPVPAQHEPPRPPDTLVEIAEGLGMLAMQAPDVVSALRLLSRRNSGPRRVLICGSLYLAGGVLALQEGVTAQPN